MRGQRDVVIVGAGAGGTLVANHLRRRCPDLTVTVVGTGHPAGRGVAYSTTDLQHLMNVPTKRLSVDADGSDHLARWLADRDLPTGPEDYPPRAHYGAYLADRLAATGAEVIDAQVVAAREVPGTSRARWELELGDGSTIEAGVVVLAGGPPPGPGPVPLPDHPAVLADPWVTDLADRAADAGEVLVLGTGLTMVDVALTAARVGARVTAVSRHGWPPRAHPVHREPPTEGFPVPPGPLTAAQVRRLLVMQGRTEPAGWPAAMDAARDRADAVWARLPEPEQAKLLRRGFSAWTVHRHRMAPRVADRFVALFHTDQVRIERGTVAAVSVDRDAAVVTTRDGRTRRAPLVVSCTGPSSDVGRTTDPLLQHLLAAGTVALGPHRLGLAVDRDGRVADGLFAVGALRKGTLMETTAVPEIRGQAVALAELLA